MPPPKTPRRILRPATPVRVKMAANSAANSPANLANLPANLPLRSLKIIEREQFYPWQESLVKILEADLDPETLIWVYSDKEAACDAACDAGKSALARYLQHHGLSLLLRGQDVAGATRILARADLSKVKTIVWDLAANESSIPWELVADLASGVIGGRNTPAVLVPPTPTVVLARCPPDTDCKCRLLVIEGSILYDDC